MKAVNLVPRDARRTRSAGGSSRNVELGRFGPAQFVVVLLVIVVAVVLLRVLADNSVNNKKATLAAVQSQVVTEQSEAAALHKYISFVQLVRQREGQVKAIAEERFAWKRSLDQISHVLPAKTVLTSLSASPGTSATGVATGPTFSLNGCVATKNLNGVATVLRRLRALPGVINISFQSGTREATCNSFSLTFTYRGPAGTTAQSAAVTTTPTTATTTTTTTGDPG